MLDRHDLLDFLELIQEHLDRPITLVAAGGTALTLLDLKPSTLDVDFTGPAKDIQAFKEALRKEPHGFKVDLWDEGWVFLTGLPPDYLEKAIHIQAVGNIRLFALHPLDMVITKIGRFDARDQQDIWSAITQHHITADEVRQRAKQISYVANEGNFEHNLEVLLREMRRRT